MQNENPFASPQTSNDDYIAEVATPDDAEVIRRKYLSREANIQSLGVIFLIGAAIFGVTAIGFLFGFFEDFRSDILKLVFVSSILLGIAVLHGWIGIGLRRLSRTVRIPAAVVCVPWMFSLGLPTIISIVGLIMLVGQKASYVFSPEYQQIRLATPQVKLKTSIVVWILLVILLVFIAALFAGSFFVQPLGRRVG
jgi:hypothetical protein